jgi:hypothetical protein
MIAIRNAEFDCYCERVEKHLPASSSRFLRWLRSRLVEVSASWCRAPRSGEPFFFLTGVRRMDASPSPDNYRPGSAVPSTTWYVPSSGSKRAGITGSSGESFASL